MPLVGHGHALGILFKYLARKKKRGGKPVAILSRDKPGEVINNNGLIDIHFSGNPFTWSNRRKD